MILRTRSVVIAALTASSILTAGPALAEEGPAAQPAVIVSDPVVHDDDLSLSDIEAVRQLGADAMARQSVPNPVPMASLLAGGRLTVDPGPVAGLVALYAENVPNEVRTVVNATMADMASVIAFNPASPVEVAVEWTDQIPSLGQGGHHTVRIEGQWVPAPLADTLYGKDHTPGRADAFLMLSSSSPETFHYDPASEVPQDKWSLYALAAHELTHALGFASTFYTDGSFGDGTELYNQHLVHNGKRLVDMGAAERAAAVRSEQVQFDLGNGWALDVYDPAEPDGSSFSHFPPDDDPFNSETDAPGILMSPRLSNGSTRGIDGAVLAVLHRIGWPMRLGPSGAVQLTASDNGSGTTVGWALDLRAALAPPREFRVDVISNRAITASTTVPAGTGGVSLPAGFGPVDSVRATPIDVSGRAWPATSFTADGRLIASAATVEEIAAARDFLTSHADVLRLYFAFFNRNPDVAGARYWIRDIFDTGNPLERIAENFAVSEEFQNTYGDTDNRRFLEVVYLNVLGRNFDQAGFDYWLDTLEGTNVSGANPDLARISRGSVVRWITAGTEFVAAHPY